MSFLTTAVFLNAAVLTFAPAKWCETGTGASCSDGLLGNPADYRQIVVLPTGYRADEYWKFRADFDRYVFLLTHQGNIYSTVHPDRIIVEGYWTPGGALGAADSKFGGAIAPHPVRGMALTLDQTAVQSTVDSLTDVSNRPVRPIGVMVLFNSNEAYSADGRRIVTANASPPSFLGREYGIAKTTVGFLNAGDEVASHETAHASLNFLDEYVEGGFENTNISSFNAVTSLAVLGQGWANFGTVVGTLLGTYSMKFSEILASNGNDNIDVTRYTSRVSTPGYTPNDYEYEGGMFFGRGTYHDAGRNLMSSDNFNAQPDNGFAYDHSRSQLGVVNQVFGTGHPVARPNDRIAAAGPIGFWRASLGSTTHVMLFDGDKNHQFHPTRTYDVEVGWYDRRWKTCWGGGFFPYPCYDDIWTTARKSISPTQRKISLRASALYGLAGAFQTVACKLGVSQLGSFQLCAQPLDTVATSFLPTFNFSLPYEDTDVPASQWFTQYYWRFRTNNGGFTSGYTGWSGFYRTL